jgi:hypothetical protein
MEGQARANEDLQLRFEERYWLLVYVWRKLRHCLTGAKARRMSDKKGLPAKLQQTDFETA